MVFRDWLNTTVRCKKLKKSKSVFICSTYRPPSYLSSCIDNLSKNSELFILGDLTWEDVKKYALSTLANDLCKAKALVQPRVTQTSSSIIDLMLSNSNFTNNCKVVETGLSDYLLVIINRTYYKIKGPPKFLTPHSFKNFTDEAFYRVLETVIGPMSKYYKCWRYCSLQ